MIEGGSRIKDFLKGSTVYLPQLRKSTVFSSEAEGMHVFFFIFTFCFSPCYLCIQMNTFL